MKKLIIRDVTYLPKVIHTESEEGQLECRCVSFQSLHASPPQWRFTGFHLHQPYTALQCCFSHNTATLPNLHFPDFSLLVLTFHLKLSPSTPLQEKSGGGRGASQKLVAASVSHHQPYEIGIPLFILSSSFLRLISPLQPEPYSTHSFNSVFNFSLLLAGKWDLSHLWSLLYNFFHLEQCYSSPSLTEIHILPLPPRRLSLIPKWEFKPIP